MRSRRACRSGGLAGFTLIEVTLSASLMALILVSAYLCLQAAFSSQKLIEPRIEALQSGRVAMGLMTADLRAACPLSKDIDFIGAQHNLGVIEAGDLTFATHNYTPKRMNEGDFCEISYFLETNSESGEIVLWRRRNPMISPEPFVGGRREELAHGVQGLRFEYSDGLDWYDSWGDIKGKAKEESSLRNHANLTRMPEAVRITLWLEAEAAKPAVAGQETRTNEPALVFQTVVRLNLAAKSQADNSSASSSGDSSGQATPSGGANP